MLLSSYNEPKSEMGVVC